MAEWINGAAIAQQIQAEVAVEAARIKERGIKPGLAVVIVGDDPARLADFEKKGYTLVGDVDPAKVFPKCSYLTPVPGGVGPLTIAMLMANTVRAAAALCGSAVLAGTEGARL